MTTILWLTLFKQIIVLNIILYVGSEAIIFHYFLLGIISFSYILTLIGKNSIFHKTKINTSTIISWPFTIVEVLIFYNYGWYDLMVLWPIFAYIDLHTTYKG